MTSGNNPLWWLAPWEPSYVVVIATLLAAVFFIRGCSHTQVPFGRKLCFWLGLLSLYAMCHTVYDYYAEHEFFMHRIQHSVLHHLGPFLLVLSRPGAVLAKGLPVTWQRYLEAVPRIPLIQAAARLLNQPVMTMVLFAGLILLWLEPPIHFIAMLDWRLYRVMNWGMALNGLMFWGVVLNNFAIVPTHYSAAKRIAIMLAVIPPQIVIGVLLFTAPRELYPIYTLCGRAFGIAALADQQLGGIVLWVSGAMMSVAGILAVMKREWLQVP